jgi:tetratricopeptide (TPR) repeat protein
MVGRERELGLLLEAFDRSVTEARCVLATVLGMPGVGKSRLVHEFVASTADRATVLRGRCLPYGEGITFWPVVNIVHEAAGITEGDSPEGARAKIEALLPEGDDRVVLRDRVAAAVGLGEATWAIQETFWAIRKLLESVASHRPLVVVFDDIHWGEPAFLDLVEYLEGWSSASAIVLLCIARPELLQTRSGWASAATESTIITLNRLDGEESDRLIQNLLGPSAVPDGFRRRIAETAEGNPLFVEEMLGMLIDEERLRWEEGLWVVVEEGSAVPIPPNIQALLAARIEQLPEAEREIMQTASVVGKIFWWGAVADLSSAGDRTQIGSQLQDLVRKGMIRPGPSALAGQDAFRFHHILIRDAAYDSVPRGSRADLHERVAAWIERAVGERIEEYEEIVGYHLEQACHHGVVSPTASDLELAAKASRMLASAGRRALDRDDVNAALNLLTRAARLSSADDREALEVRRLLAQALEEAGDLQQTDGVLSDLVGRARAIGDQRAEWRARIMRAWLVAGTTTVPTDEVKRIATRAIEVFGQLGDERGLSSSWSFIAWLAFNAGRIGEAEKATAKSVLHARAAGDTALEMDQLASSAQHAANGQMPVEDALAVCRKMLHQVTGYPSHESTVRTSLGTLEAMRGNFDAAREDIQHARVVCRDLGNTHQLASMTAYAGFVEWYAGDIEAEARERQAGYDAFAGMGAGGYVATWAAWLARPLIHLGREDEAFELTRESERLAAEDDVTAQVPSREARATILARRGQMEDAEKLARTAVTIAERTDWLNLQGDAQTTLAEVLWLAGRSDEAADAAQRALDRYEGKGNIVAAGWARTLLEDLRVG